MFDTLSAKLEKAFKIIKGNGAVTEINVAETTKEIRRALLEADVNYKLAKSITDTVKQKALGQKVLDSVSPGQLLIKIVHDELVELMGGQESPLALQAGVSVFMLLGLNGSGKTTTAVKLANYLKSTSKKKVLLVAADTFRPAAIEQLQALADTIQVDVYSEPEEKNPLKVVENALAYAKTTSAEAIIIDTAGRQVVNEELMSELAELYSLASPNETLFVADAMTGQEAVTTAQMFNEKLSLTGVVLTKVDGDARGGAALSIKTALNKPIKFIGTSEKIAGLEVFKPQQIAGRILGKGDIVSFVEKVQQSFDQKEALDLQKKLRKNQFDLNDFLKQIAQIKKMGSIKDLLSMLPGVGNKVKDLEISNDIFINMEVMISSMTPYERANPAVLDQSRKLRIAKGSGKKSEDLNNFLKQFQQMSKLMKREIAGKRPLGMPTRAIKFK